MSKLQWDQTGKRTYETGVDKGVLYVKDPSSDNGYAPGVAWNGLTNVNESPSGAETTSLYADNIKYLNMLSAEEFGATVEAYTYPPEFEECDGTAAVAEGVMIGQQARKHFGFCYRTLIGNDEVGTEKGYKIHIIYDCVASPSEKSYGTVNDSPDAVTFSWTLSANSIRMANEKALMSLTIDSTKLSATALENIEKALYGDVSTEPKMLTPDEIVQIVTANPLSRG